MEYIKRQISVHAIQWTGNNYLEVKKFIDDPTKRMKVGEDDQIILQTLDGHMSAHLGDYIIKTHKGEVYPCSAESFNEIYQPHGFMENDPDVLQA